MVGGRGREGESFPVPFHCAFARLKTGQHVDVNKESKGEGIPTPDMSASRRRYAQDAPQKNAVFPVIHIIQRNECVIRYGLFGNIPLLIPTSVVWINLSGVE